MAEIVTEQTDGWEATVTDGVQKMKPWEEVTERERGWIEGVLSANTRSGKRGTINSYKQSLRICLGAEPHLAHQLQSLLGGQVCERLKKRAFTHVVQEGDLAGTVYTYDTVYNFEWEVEGADFAYVVECLNDLKLPYNLRNGVNAYFAASLNAHSH